jgi:hypothetical protein
MALEAVVSELIPGKWPRLLAVITLVAAPAAFALPSALPAAWLPPTELSAFLLRLLFSLVVFGIGTTASLFALVRHFRWQSAEFAAALSRAAESAASAPKPYPSPTGPLNYPNLRIP